MSSLPVLDVYGDYASWLLANNIKLFTLRRDTPKYAEHVTGSHIVIRYGQDQFSLGNIFSREVKPLKEFSLAELYLDGYTSAESAAVDLRSYKGYEKTTVDTPLVGIGFTTDAHFNSYLTEEQRELIVTMPLDVAIRDRRFRGFFMPSYLHWLHFINKMDKVNITVGMWHSLLQHLELFTKEELLAVKNFDKKTAKFYSGLRSKAMVNILFYSPTYSPEYKSLVLCEPISVSK